MQIIINKSHKVSDATISLIAKKQINKTWKTAFKAH